MGYTTEFDGGFKFSRPITLIEASLINNFADADHRDEQGMPGIWCQWVVSEDGTRLEWDGNEKFYDYVEWLEYLIEHYFSKWDLKLNGVVMYQGEEIGDVGEITVKNNIVSQREYK